MAARRWCSAGSSSSACPAVRPGSRFVLWRGLGATRRLRPTGPRRTCAETSARSLRRVGDGGADVLGSAGGQRTGTLGRALAGRPDRAAPPDLRVSWFQTTDRGNVIRGSGERQWPGAGDGRPRSWLVVMTALLALTGARWAGVAAPHSPGSPDTSAAPAQPNVVLIVADDLDKKLLRWMPQTRRLVADQGATFDRYYVEQSTCCTSRASILSGEYTHNHGVRGNHYPAGGFFRWHEGRESEALPTWLEANGYDSALLGKYLNEYPYPGGYDGTEAEKDALEEFVPPGWQSWFSPVGGTPYRQSDTVLNVNGEVDAEPRTEFLDQLMGDRLLDLVDGLDGMNLRDGGKFVYYASYSPHSPYPAPERLRHRVPGRALPADAELRRGRRQRQVRPERRPRPDERREDRPDRRDLPAAGPGRPGPRRQRRSARPAPGGAGHARQHLRRVHLRQRLQHGRAPARHRQVQPVRGDRQRAAAGARSGHRGRAPTSASWPATSTSRRPSRT